ncbi:MAG: PDZ domain-containing protein [Burkholderiaceae bacterium]
MPPIARNTVRRRASTSIPAGVRYRLTPIDPKGHLFEVVCDVFEPSPAGQRFTLPAWIPGSYMIREFARNIVSISAHAGSTPLALVKKDKDTWIAPSCDGPLQLRYRVYAWDASVRAAHLDETHAFVNGTSVFLCVEGFERAPHDVELIAPVGRAYRDWQVATTLPEHGAARHGFGTYRADDYDALVDHPIEMGTFRLERFVAAGVAHEIAYTGVVPNLDAACVNADLARLCAAQIRFFSNGESTGTDAPFDRYLFLTTVSGEGYGGLEHRSSTALLCTRDSLPIVKKGKASDRSNDYLTFLGLVSHEYFHSWNVKRMKPAVFAPYDLSQENYTSLLWIFEGFTSYYDDLFLLRTGLATEAQYFAMIAKTIDDILAGEGRRTQSVAESSFDAWTKYYRQDENAPNAIVSYYKKGSLIALCLDLTIRQKRRGKSSLDDAMRLMWQRYGRDFYEGGLTGLPEDAFPALIREATGVDVHEQIQRWAYGTDDLPLSALLAAFGITLRFTVQRPGPSIGARITTVGTDTRLAGVPTGGAAHAAGLSAGDTLIAIDGLRVMPGRLDTLLARHQPGDAVELTTFRNDVLQVRKLTLAAAAQTAAIESTAKPTVRAAALRDAWLKG